MASKGFSSVATQVEQITVVYRYSIDSSSFSGLKLNHFGSIAQ